jgi:branched-chain amino acid transport system substrate-binding protein
MRTSLLARGRRLRVGACAALSVALAGCAAAGSSTVTVAGQNLTIYAGLPPAGAATPESRDVFAAEQLALKQTGSRVGRATVRLVPVQGKETSDNARSAIQDTSAIAYLGEIAPGASADSIGITNAQDLLQVSPTDTAVAATQFTSAVPGSPNLYYESLKTYHRTFARVVPTTALEARALVSLMQSLGVRQLALRTDGSDYGKALALAVRNHAGSGISVTSPSAPNADAVLFAGSASSEAAKTFDQAVAGNPKIKLFAPSALAQQSFAATLTPAAQHALYVTQPGFYKDLSAAGQKFQSDFESAYGHAPAPQAIFGYEAMASVLAVLREAGSAANNRSTVVRDYFALKNRDSVLGTYSINANGDTSLDAFAVSRVKRGQLTPFKALAAQG